MYYSFLVASVWLVTLLTVVSSSTPRDIEKFYSIVKQLGAKKDNSYDKVTVHSYQEMYGTFLLPFVKERHRNEQPIKFFEIGMGCDGANFYGGSIEIWNAIFSEKDDLWTADHSGECIETAKKDGTIRRFKALIGDQGNNETLAQWMKTSGGKFDIIIDDGGHGNMQIYNTLYNLWSHVNPGGLYFIEDMQIGRNPGFNSEGIVMSDVIRDWIEQLIINEPHQSYRFKIMPHVKSIFCQNEACVVLKCGPKDLGRCESEYDKYPLKY